MRLAGVLLNLVEVVASDNCRSLVDPAERDGFLRELELCTAAAREVELLHRLYMAQDPL